METPFQIFNNSIQELKDLHKNNPGLDWSLITQKILYEAFIQPISQKPKIQTKYPAFNFQNSFKNSTNTNLKANTKEHMILTLHNILPTNDRLKNCNYSNNGCCFFCQQRETISHVFECNTSTPAVKWVLRKMFFIQPSTQTTVIRDIFLLNFVLSDTKKQNSAVWLISNFSLALWKARKKKDPSRIIGETVETLKMKFRRLKLNPIYEEKFYPMCI